MNHILTAKHGYRCAVLLNEIADSADIERALVKEPEVGWLGRVGAGAGSGGMGRFITGVRVGRLVCRSDAVGSVV